MKEMSIGTLTKLIQRKSKIRKMIKTIYMKRMRIQITKKRRNKNISIVIREKF